LSAGFVAPVPVRWSDIDMYQHINHATMVTLLEEARVPFLRVLLALTSPQLVC
jgi:acyl-CoA thioester hydrolase